MNDSQYLFAESGNECFLKITGSVNYTTCLGFKKFTEQLLQRSKLNKISINLCEAKSIDSTNLGVIAKYANYMITHCGSKAIIYSTNPNITSILNGSGFGQVFEIVDEIRQPLPGLYPIPGSEFESKKEIGDTLIESHTTLMNLNEENREKYSNIVEALRNSPSRS